MQELLWKIICWMFFLFIFPLNKYISLISSFFKTYFKINFKMIFSYLFYFSFWEGISLKISQGTKEESLILAQENRWEIINNILEPEERKISIPHDLIHFKLTEISYPLIPLHFCFTWSPKRYPLGFQVEPPHLCHHRCPPM